MRLEMGGINGHYLLNIIANCARDTEEVLAAVAYVSVTMRPESTA
jgi:hypothetical protein